MDKQASMSAKNVVKGFSSCKLVSIVPPSSKEGRDDKRAGGRDKATLDCLLDLT